jgi:hypothetical protein
MRNLAANFGKILDVCKKFSKNLVNERGNLPRRGPVPRFSDLEVIALSLTAEKYGIDSESLLFSLLEEYYKTDFPNLISYLAKLKRFLLVANTMTVVSSYLRFASNDSKHTPPTYANKYENSLPKRLMETKIIFVLIQSRYRCVVSPVQSVAN